MAGSTQQVAVGTNPVLLSVAGADGRQDSKIAVKVRSTATEAVWVGFSDDVDETTGFPVDPGETWAMDLQIDEAVYGFAETGPVTAYVCRGGV